MADINVATNLAASVDSNQTDQAIIWTGPDTCYVFYYTLGQTIVYKKSTTGLGGLAAASEVVIDSKVGCRVPVAVHDRDFDPGSTGDIIHIFWTENVDDQIHYRTLDTSTDTLGTDRTAEPGASYSVTSSWVNKSLAATKTPGGNLYVTGWGDGSGEKYARKSTNGGVSWSDTASALIATNEGHEIIALPWPHWGDDNDYCLLQWDGENDTIKLHVYDQSADSWTVGDSPATITGTWIPQRSTWPSAFNQWNWTAGVRHVDQAIWMAAYNDFHAVGNDLKLVEITGSGTSITVTIKADAITDVRQSGYPSICIDQQADELYVFYSGSDDDSETLQSTVQQYYKKYNFGSNSWGSQQAYSVDDDDHRLTIAPRSITDLGGYICAVWFNDDTDIFRTNLDNALAITAVSAEPVGVAVVGVAGAFGPDVQRRPGRVVGY